MSVPKELKTADKWDVPVFDFPLFRNVLSSISFPRMSCSVSTLYFRLGPPVETSGFLRGFQKRPRQGTLTSTRVETEQGCPVLHFPISTKTSGSFGLLGLGVAIV